MAGMCEPLTGEVITPCDGEYNSARQEWNRRIQRYPDAIAYCSNTADVRSAVAWASVNCSGVRLRSGGHNYEGYSVGDGVLVIDVSRLKRTQVGADGNTLRVGGGVVNREAYLAAAAQGRPFAGGTCPTVGLSGYALGGGWGLTCRSFGLGCDNLLALDLVDYMGDVVHASAECNPDLYWACRGAGGGNFGVVTSMTFRLPGPVGRVTYLELYYPEADAAKMAEFIARWQAMLPTLDRRMGLLGSVYNAAAEGHAIFCRGLYQGTPQEAEALLQPLATLGGATTTFDYLPYIEAIAKVGAAYPNHQTFKSTGRFVGRPFTAGEIRALVSLISDRPTGSIYTGLGLYSLGGAVRDVAPSSTAFWYRGAAYILGIQSIWENPVYTPDNVAWVDRRFPVVAGLTMGSYVNFPFSGLRDYMRAYFGANADRLVGVKRRYDPHDFFRFPQSIEV